MIENEIRELLQTVNQQTRKEFARRFRELNLHVGQESALCILWEKDGITQTQLREKMGCEAPTLSNMLRTLEQDGIVYRQKSADDGRSTNVYLTQKGSDLREPVTTIWEEQQAQMLHGILPEELLLVRRILQQIIGNMAEES